MAGSRAASTLLAAAAIHRHRRYSRRRLRPGRGVERRGVEARGVEGRGEGRGGEGRGRGEVWRGVEGRSMRLIKNLVFVSLFIFKSILAGGPPKRRLHS
ncbi:hypothetical protein [Oryza sativa Japonica Group]|uniref:Uncharacterized protein P0416D03.28 n=1 Tax=Oryza sativa subsp. japonica TaxID=39947 RepID=Q5ZDM8_ORYSJ|nr:hypothetical protein [Oryza sativa Japonica Group]